MIIFLWNIKFLLLHWYLLFLKANILDGLNLNLKVICSQQDHYQYSLLSVWLCGNIRRKEP